MSIKAPKPKEDFRVEQSMGNYIRVLYLPHMADAVDRLIDIPGVIGINADHLAGQAVIRAHRLYDYNEIGEAVHAVLQERSERSQPQKTQPQPSVPFVIKIIPTTDCTFYHVEFVPKLLPALLALKETPYIKSVDIHKNGGIAFLLVSRLYDRGLIKQEITQRLQDALDELEGNRND